MSLYNSDGYLDPTAYEALSNLERENKKQKKLVFICAPYAGDIEGNVMRAKRYGRFAVTEGAVPIIPHLMYTQFLFDDDKEERKLGIEMGLALLSKCEELWIFGNQLSQGMVIEIKRAKSKNMTVRQFSTECEWVGGAKR
ncbi:DUF4406 domain-containing protein [Bacillus alkalicola]|uniref:DUF4406 domain-containing protein n=1 Tax=Evansella alkalicola TaxID=745819 RepID=A0ABS6JWZ3_9BACI|nr:DUF4406 domain-containing protein [Bacillus alkalicola]